MPSIFGQEKSVLTCTSVYTAYIFDESGITLLYKISVCLQFAIRNSVIHSQPPFFF